MKHWTSYWQNSGALNSFAEGRVAQGYDGDVKAFWDDKFSLFPRKGEVVDLGTGNGALAILAQEYADSNNLEWCVSGVDAAEISPFLIQGLNEDTKSLLDKIEFLGSTFIESMEYPDNSVSAFISQFGFEYSDKEVALERVYRTLKPRGLVCLVMHTEESEIVSQSKVGIKINEKVFSSELFPKAIEMFEQKKQIVKRVGAKGWAESQLFLDFNDHLRLVVENLMNLFSKRSERLWIESVVVAFAEIMRASVNKSADIVLEELTGLRERLLFHNQRLTDQVSASFTTLEKNKFKNLAINLGFSIDTSSVLYVDGENVGWCLVLQKD